MASVTDYSAFFEASPNAHAILSAELVVVAVNKAFRETVGRSDTELIGRHLFDAFPPAGHTRDTNSNALKASFERVLTTGLTDQLHMLAYPIVRPHPNGPVSEERYWSITNVPICGAGGAVEFIMQHVVDITAFESFKRSDIPPADKTFLDRLSPIEGNVFV